MNRTVVRRAAAGLAAWLRGAGRRGGRVVIGYDGRHGSHDFAKDSAAIFAAAGFDALLLPRLLPTPVLAFAVQHLERGAGRDGHRLAQPAAGQRLQGLRRRRRPDRAAGRRRDRGGDPARSGRRARSRCSDRLHRARRRRSSTPTSTRSPAWSADRPARAADRAHRHARRRHRGRRARCFAAAGFAPPIERARAGRSPTPTSRPSPSPTPRSPARSTWPWPWPRDRDADLVIANDPDADRCAVAVPTDGGWRMLRGDEVGVLLADALLRKGIRGTYATTIVSSTMLRRDGRAARRRLRRDADRLQVDLARRARPGLRLRGGAGLRGRARPGARQGRHQRRAVGGRTAPPRSSGRIVAAAAPGRAGRRVRPARHRPALGAGRRPVDHHLPPWPGCGRRRPATLLGAPSWSRDLLPAADVVR